VEISRKREKVERNIGDKGKKERALKIKEEKKDIREVFRGGNYLFGPGLGLPQICKLKTTSY